MAAIVNAGSRFGSAFVKWSTPLAKNAWKYGKVELMPPGPGQWGKALEEGGQVVKSVTSGKFLQQTTSQALVNLVVVADITFCFFIGECIGKGSLVGYKIKGAHLDASSDDC
ncbi:ATP synthase subunit g, mitochondrial-like [Watersipora subatra]|uniref:ATP synthase subunit g, mitochondrial-like n=1 Tax=Watersipora subatra TaxID=2589382 RepID=UPI00355C309F